MRPSKILFVDDEALALKYFERLVAPLAPVLVAGSVEEVGSHGWLPARLRTSFTIRPDGKKRSSLRDFLLKTLADLPRFNLQTSGKSRP